jgi:hypothetical protein
MKELRNAVLACVLLPATLAAGEKAVVPELPVAHRNASGTIRFRTPAGWTLAHTAGFLEQTEARGDGLIVRILRHDGELGLDSLHSQCMDVRLAVPMETRPDVDYEYDFVGGAAPGDRRGLDSAFVVHYDEAIGGSRDWRQRNLTVVGKGESLCVIGYAPAGAWKKSKQTRGLLKAVLDSVEWQPWR